MRVRFALLPLSLALAACKPPVPAYECTTAQNCNQASGGQCIGAYCAYPDPACGTGLRYDPSAGHGLASTCVPAICGLSPNTAVCGADGGGAGTCVDLLTDDSNCGRCGNTCPAGQSCSAGSCAETCAPGYSACTVALPPDGGAGEAGKGDGTAPDGGAVTRSYCADLETDPANCGACGNVCPSGLCSAASCVLTAAPVSFISPGGVATGGAHAGPVDFTLSAQGAATLFYTTDGSLPVRGGAKTLSAPSPVTLTGIAPPGMSTDIQWFADYGPPLGRELVVHSYMASDPGPGNDLGSMVQHVRFTGAGGPVIVVAAGATVRGSADWQVWRSNGAGYCPGCAIEWVLGVDGVGQVGCFVYGGATYPGQNGTQSFSFTAPAKHGRYPMRQGLSLQFTCAAAGYPGGEEVGEVIVE